jgi:hypothetical protein
MRADTKSISIEASVRRVAAFLSDPTDLPRWAVGFAKGVRRTENGWLVETTGGDMPIRIARGDATGVVDFLFSPSPGVDVLAASRVIAHGPHSEYVFTQSQPPEMPDEMFARNVQTLTHELTVLKALMEVDCPL